MRESLLNSPVAKDFLEAREGLQAVQKRELGGLSEGSVALGKDS